MGVFPCGSCPKIFPYEKRLKDHLKKDHGIKKDYLINKQIAEWKGTVIPSVQAPEELKECCYCKKGFNPKDIAAHKRRCSQKGEAAVSNVSAELEGFANEAVQGTQEGTGNAPLGFDATSTTPENQDSIPNSKEGHKAAFQQFLVSRNATLKSIKGYMDLLNQWMDQCGDVEADGNLLIEKFPQFIEQLPSDWKKQEAFRMYGQFTCYAASLEGLRHGTIEFELVDGKAVPCKEKAYISRPRVLPILQEGDTQNRGKGCRNRKQTEVPNVPKPMKSVKIPGAKPSEPLVPIPMDVHTTNIIPSAKPYQKKRGKAVTPDWVDEDGNPRWYDEDDDDDGEWGKVRGKGKGKGKGKGGKGK